MTQPVTTRAGSPSGLPREECRLSETTGPVLGWTVLDPAAPGRTAQAQAETLGRLYQRQPVYLRQTHLSYCAVLHGAAALPALPLEADGVITDRSDLLMGVSAADCLPLFLVSARATAVLHAGWRGVLGGILPRAIGTLRDKFGVDVQDLNLYAGPGIGACCFEVSEAVGCCFPESARRPSPNKLHLDLLHVVELQWQLEGASSALARLGRCTHCSFPRLHSFRRDGGAGRNFAYLYHPGTHPRA